MGVQINVGERVGRVRITTGNAAVGPNDAMGTDIVVMDDCIYSERVACIQADIDCDRIIDVRDYGVWRQQFGQTGPTITPTSNATATPTTTSTATAKPTLPGRAYVANHSGNTMTVIDTTTNIVVGSPIPVGMSPSGVGIGP